VFRRGAAAPQGRGRCATLAAVEANHAAVAQQPVGANLAALLGSAARSDPDGPALVDGHRRLTWARLEQESVAVAGGLAQMGVVAGNRVAILLGNRAEFVTVYLGALGAGLVAVPLNPAATTGEIVRVLADCAARVVVCEAATAPTARAAVTGLAEALQGADERLRSQAVVPEVVVVDAPALPGEHAYADLGRRTCARIPPPRDPQTLAVLLYTAGTSGRPRAAMLTHRSLLANVGQVAAISPPPVAAGDRVLGVLPLFHVYGLNAVLGQALLQGACVVLTERFDPERTLALIEAEAVTNVPLAPPALAAWADRDDLAERLSGVRTVLCGASPLPADLARRFTRASGIDVHQGYGLTEASPVVTSTLCSPSRPPKPGSVGRPVPGVQVRLVDDAGDDAGHDPGELWVRGDNLFCGYWPDRSNGPGADGWYATGDVGYVDADGDLFLVDRLKEIVIVSGFNVYPVEVEEAIGEVPGVREVAVIGAPHPAGGERVTAYVVAEQGAGTGGLPAERLADDVRAHCEARLSPFKRPSEVHVVAELPHSVTGKVAKGRLRDHEQRRAIGLE
jgi:long-chain acyl-CoA synthetase